MQMYTFAGRMKIQIINGPNLNLLGRRETAVYGSSNFESFLAHLRQEFPTIQLDYFQSNIEGELINCLHECGFTHTGIILNAGAYTHTSIALADAIAAIETPVIEVHISNVYAREEYRHQSLIAPKCIGQITGFGLASYSLALHFFINNQPT